MNARKMKRRAYRHQGHLIQMRKRLGGYMAQQIEITFRRIVRDMVKKVIQPFLDMVEASAKAGKSMNLLAGAVGGVSSFNWAPQGFGLPPHHLLRNEDKPGQAT